MYDLWFTSIDCLIFTNHIKHHSCELVAQEFKTAPFPESELPQ